MRVCQRCGRVYVTLNRVSDTKGILYKYTSCCKSTIEHTEPKFKVNKENRVEWN